MAKYGDDRRTEITQIDIKPEEKEVIAVVPEDVVVIMSQSGEVKRVPSKNFNSIFKTAWPEMSSFFLEPFLSISSITIMPFHAFA